jgi:hypothetical protein
LVLAEYVLRMLGLATDEAAEVARRPLPAAGVRWDAAESAPRVQ